MTEATPAPDIDTIECAAEILGCSSWFQGQTRIVCETHSNTDWPCPETVGLATKLAARDACRGRAAVAALARVEALAEEWDGDDSCDNRTCVPHRSADALRAALAGSEADTSDTQSTDQEDQS